LRRKGNLKNSVIVFSGFNQRAVVAFLRTLKKNDIDFYIIAKSQEDTIFNTIYKENIYAVRDSLSLENKEDIFKLLINVRKQAKAKKIFLSPSTEALNRFFLENKKELEQIGCVIPLVDMDLYQAISDKYSFGELCGASGILIPKEIKQPTPGSVPFVAKPKKYFSNHKPIAHTPVLVLSNEEYIDFMQRNANQLDDFYFQQFLNGKSYYLLYYFHRNGRVYKFSQENIVQQPDGKSIVAAVSSDFHLSEEAFKYERFFKKNNFFGLVMVEVKQDDGKNYMIEANPRFWGPSQLFVDANNNFFEAILHDFGFISTEPEINSLVQALNYFWLGGAMESLKLNKNLTYHMYDEMKFFEYLPQWLQSDIYRRSDTMSVFKNEII
jgi:predicted ATP-grasp superfamily ATP-dependent carboligase